MSRYYRLLLDDYSAASFTSFDKDYFGTLEQIDSFFQAIKSDEDVATGRGGAGYDEDIKQILNKMEG